MSYNESERYILVLSHDEVVHLKCSMLGKMPGLEEDKYKNLMAGYAFMMGHPGKKLLFMGQEFAQGQEWSEARELDWYVLKNPNHQHVQNMFRKLMHIYRNYPAMYQQDVSWAGFEWINADDAYRSIFSFVRKSKDNKNNLLFVINFTPVAYEDYRVGVLTNKKHELLLDSQSEEFGGEGSNIAGTLSPEKSECDHREYSIGFSVAPYQVAIFTY